ncbi:MAG TPA: metallophosphoesterase [Isosphaeraceae bacterium]|jgi:Icc-related predicted phosphoesterase|nr:metallophosphoesterase [Isosphaeraceae bacterium]
MRFLVISDLHGDLPSACAAIETFEPDVLLSCGDWGDPGEISQTDLAAFPARLPVYTTFGNHDPLEWLAHLKNQDGSSVLLEQGKVTLVSNVRLAAIGGIWAKSHRLPHYVTDADVAEMAARIAEEGPVDILLTHACPVGLADLTPSGRHGGQRCFLDAFDTIAPRIHICGHLHVPQKRTLKDGRIVLNVGETPAGSVVVIEAENSGITAYLERLNVRKQIHE